MAVGVNGSTSRSMSARELLAYLIGIAQRTRDSEIWRALFAEMLARLESGDAGQAGEIPVRSDSEGRTRAFLKLERSLLHRRFMAELKAQGKFLKDGLGEISSDSYRGDWLSGRDCIAETEILNAMNRAGVDVASIKANALQSFCASRGPADRTGINLNREESATEPPIAAPGAVPLLVRRSDPLITERAAAGYFSVSSDVMRQWRSRGGGPRFFNIGGRVRYALSDLEAWRQDPRNGRRRTN